MACSFEGRERLIFGVPAILNHYTPQAPPVQQKHGAKPGRRHHLTPPPLSVALKLGFSLRF
jgi:hypothetical protein